MLHSLIFIALLCYLATTFLSLFLLGRMRVILQRSSLLMLRLGFVAHTLALVVLLSKFRFDIFAGYGDYYFWLSWTIIALTAFRSRLYSSPAIMSLVAGVSSLFLVSSSVLVHQDFYPPTAQTSPLIWFHIIPALLAEAFLVLSVVVSIAYLFKDRLLKKNAAQVLTQRGPSLDQLGGLSYRFVVAGFVAMSFAILSGVVWVLSEGATLLRNDPLQWSAFAAWMMLGLLLHGQSTYHWSTRRSAQITVLIGGGLSLCILALIFLNGNVFHDLSAIRN